MLRGGYMGRLLEVDLTRGVVHPIPLPAEEVMRQYVGCTGLGLYLFSKEITPDMKITDSDSPIFILTGPLTGTLVPQSANWGMVCLNYKVPYHVGMSQSHGYWGARLKHAGWDGIIIRGASEKPVFLWIDDDKVELLDASRYWGMTTTETQRRIQMDYQDIQNISVACIGPGGENLLAGAAVRCDRCYGASMGSGGIAWGSKKLKAIAVRGSKKVPLADFATFVEVCDKWKDALRRHSRPPASREAEGLRLMPHIAAMGWFMGKNFTDPEYAAEWGKKLEECIQQWKVTPEGSWECEARCHNTTLITTGPMAGMTVSGYTGEVIEELGPNLGIDDPGVAMALCGFVDDLGIAASEVPRTIAMLMEAYNTGRITREQIDGVDLTWGNYEAVLELLQKAAKREGVGAIIANGLRPTAREFGTEALAVHMKGGGFNDHDQRAAPFALFQSQVISGAGPTWQMSGSMTMRDNEPDLGTDDWGNSVLLKEIALQQRGPRGVGAPLEPNMPLIEKATGEDFRRWHVKKMWEDTPGTCMFATRGVEGILDLAPKAVAAAVGWEDFDRQEAWLVGERVVNLQRLVSVYLGYRSQYDFDISDRLLEIIPCGPAKGMGVPRPLLSRWRKEFYTAMNWDPETGIPHPEELEKVGLLGHKVGRK